MTRSWEEESVRSFVSSFSMAFNQNEGTPAIQVLGAEVPAGTKHRLEMFVSSLSTGTPLTVPVIVVHGRLPGPRLILSAAIHGDEINGTEICRQVLDRVDPFALHGTLIVVPVVNVFGFITQSRYLPDRRDLNRSFPGSAKGSLASRLAHLFLTRLVKLCNYGIDFHTASAGKRNLPQIRANLKDPRTKELAQVFGAPVCIQARERAQSLRAVASSMGIPMLLFEGGEVLRFEKDVIETGVAGTLRVLRHLGMITTIQEEPASPPLIARDAGWIRSPRGGILHLDVGLGDSVQQRQQLGTITDMYGTVRAKVIAPDSGTVVGCATNPLVSRGDALLHLACPISSNEHI